MKTVREILIEYLQKQQNEALSRAQYFREQQHDLELATFNDGQAAGFQKVIEHLNTMKGDAK